MTEQEQLSAFQAYYGEVKERLAKAQEEWNLTVRQEQNRLLGVFLSDLADMNEGGKLLRGMLVDLGYRIGGGRDTGYADNLALAYEMFQTAVLIHDDIIDNAGTRRGKMTIHRRYLHRLKTRGIRLAAGGGNTKDLAASAALCAGDLGIIFSSQKLVQSYREHPRLGELQEYFNKVIINTMRGELLDVILPYELQDQVYSEEERKTLLEASVGDIYELKTACYSMVGPLHLGMMLAGAPSGEMEAMDAFAKELGVAYQIMDDILGIYADEEVLGKDVGSDVSEFKQTILWMYVRNRKPEEAERLLQYYGRNSITEEEMEQVRGIFRESGALQYARDAMQACYGRAEHILEQMYYVKPEHRALLAGFMLYLGGRRK